MKGMIVKDLLTLKKSSPIIILFILGCSIISISGESMVMMFMLPILMSSFVIGIFNDDAKSRWNIYSLGLPFERKHYVASKYLMVIMTALFSIVIILVTYFVFSKINMENDIKEILLLVDVSFCCSLIYPAILIPIILLFNSDIGKMIMMAIAGGMGASFSIFLSAYEDIGININLYIILAVIIVLFALSWLISTFIYEKKSL